MGSCLRCIEVVPTFWTPTRLARDPPVVGLNVDGALWRRVFVKILVARSSFRLRSRAAGIQRKAGQLVCAQVMSSLLQDLLVS